MTSAMQYLNTPIDAGGRIVAAASAPGAFTLSSW
jgi:hypothetical protein